MAKPVSPLLGYNNNIRHKNRIFHIQTEDSGIKHPHIITHLFMDGGRILKSIKRSYAEFVGVEGMSEIVRGMMKEQHKSMFIALRDGQFDHLVEGGPAPSKAEPKIEAKPEPAATASKPHHSSRHSEKKAEAPAAAQPAKAGDSKKSTVDERSKDGKTRAAVITFGDKKFGDMVGIYATADSFRNAIKFLEEEKVDVVVVRFKSGGGMLLEIQKISDVFQNEYKKKFRLVAWIDSAISAAAMSAHCFEEIYFTPQGNYGACTGFSGRLNAMKGPGLEQVLIMMEKISARGHYDPKIMRAMQISSEEDESAPLRIEPPWGALSCTVNKETGEVKYFQDATSGEIVLNPKGGVHILTFNSEQAAQVKFSKGTASNLDELGKAMGLSEVEWVGKKDKEYVWPICKAEQYMLDFRKRTSTDEKEFNRYINGIQTNLGLAAQAREAERAKFIGQVRQWLNQVKAMVKNNPNFILLNWGDDEEFQKWVEEIERAIRDLSKKK